MPLNWLVVRQDVDIKQMGLALREHVPLIISKNYQPAASSNVIEAQYEDIVATMTQVSPGRVYH
jgi:hypothetical protein